MLNKVVVMSKLVPSQIVEILDRHIIGQYEAKKAVAIAFYNRYRRKNIKDDKMREEIIPKNIVMIGPTGVGKTEIARRLAKVADAPFVKVEATKFTEVGYVGRDVDSIIRDLVENAVANIRERHRSQVKQKAQKSAEERVLDSLVGQESGAATKDLFREQLRKGELDDREVKIKVQDTPSNKGMQFMDIPGLPGSQMGVMNIGEMIGKAMGMMDKNYRTKSMTVKDALETLTKEESEKLVEEAEDRLVTEALKAVEEDAIVFIDEIDKICGREHQRGGDVSREGVQRDLLPLIEGTVVSTKYGVVRTDHILFITSGAFHLAKPSDMLPELQGRLPIRVELKPLTKEDMVRILSEPDYNLLKQYKALLATDKAELEFTNDAIEAIADYATRLNEQVENIGARRLYALMEKLLENISFEAPGSTKKKYVIDAAFVDKQLNAISQNQDLSKFIL